MGVPLQVTPLYCGAGLLQERVIEALPWHGSAPATQVVQLPQSLQFPSIGQGAVSKPLQSLFCKRSAAAQGLPPHEAGVHVLVRRCSPGLPPLGEQDFEQAPQELQALNSPFRGQQTSLQVLVSLSFQCWILINSSQVLPPVSPSVHPALLVCVPACPFVS